MKGYLPADYIQLVMCVPYTTTQDRGGLITCRIRTLSVCNSQLRHGKRGIRIIFHFSPMSHLFTGHASSGLEENLMLLSCYRAHTVRDLD